MGPQRISKICFTKELAIQFLQVTVPTPHLLHFNYPWTDLHTLLEAQLACKLELSNPSPGLSPPWEKFWHLLIYFCVLFQHLENFSFSDRNYETLQLGVVRQRGNRGSNRESGSQADGRERPSVLCPVRGKSS